MFDLKSLIDEGTPNLNPGPPTHISTYRTAKNLGYIHNGFEVHGETDLGYCALWFSWVEGEYNQHVGLIWKEDVDVFDRRSIHSIRDIIKRKDDIIERWGEEEYWSRILM